MTDKEGNAGLGTIILIACLAWLGWIIFAQINHKNTWNDWNRECLQAGGFVEQVGYNRFECFIDGEQVTLPGWEGY